MGLYLLVDWKNNNKFFIQRGFEKENITIKIIDIPNYNKKDRETKFGNIKLYFKYLKLALTTYKITSKNDIIICWNFTTSIPVGLINKLFFKKRKIIALNIIAPVRGKLIEIIKNKLFHFALSQKDLYITVNSSDLIADYSKRFNLSKNKFFVLHDPFFNNYKSSEFNSKHSYIFCGGEARRDWNIILKSAEITPDISYVLVARKKYFVEKKKVPKNVKLLFDIPAEYYYKLLEESTIVALPLKDDNPAGLINLLRAAMLSIPIISTSTPSIKNYIKHKYSGLLIESKSNPIEFATAITQLYYNVEMQRIFAKNLKYNVIVNFSESLYLVKLKEILKKINLNESTSYNK